jgi:hypothetical protein
VASGFQAGDCICRLLAGPLWLQQHHYIKTVCMLFAKNIDLSKNFVVATRGRLEAGRHGFFSDYLRAVKDSTIQDQPDKIISTPTNRPITHKPEIGHSE